jgi:hypothetical protein
MVKNPYFHSKISPFFEDERKKKKEKKKSRGKETKKRERKSEKNLKGDTVVLNFSQARSG